MNLQVMSGQLSKQCLCLPLLPIPPGGPALEYPTGCTWTADSATAPYPNRAGGIATNAPGACVPAANPGGPLACDDRWGGTLVYTFPASAGKAYQASAVQAASLLGQLRSQLTRAVSA